jgi:hypothetical protein
LQRGQHICFANIDRLPLTAIFPHQERQLSPAW